MPPAKWLSSLRFLASMAKTSFCREVRGIYAIPEQPTRRDDPRTPEDVRQPVGYPQDSAPLRLGARTKNIRGNCAPIPWHARPTPPERVWAGAIRAVYRAPQPY